MTTNQPCSLKKFALAGKSVVVTGGGYGLGRAMAFGLARAGANVVVAGRTVSRLEQTVAEISAAGGQAMAHCFDATRRSQCAALVEAAVSQYGQLDAMVINHGVIAVSAPQDLPEECWNEVISTNLSGCFYCAQAVGKQMIRQNSGGSLVMISSNGSLVGFEGLSAYGASKGGVDQLCRQLAVEWGRYAIRVNTVNPGYTTNPMSGRYETTTTAELEQEIKHRTPLQRRGNPEDFVGPVVFLCSDAASFVSGHSLVVDGGYCAV